MGRLAPAGLFAVLAVVACGRGLDPGAHALGIVGGAASVGHPEVVFLRDPVVPRSCSGAVVSRRVVVTAKHCLMDTVATDWIVLVGDEPRVESLATYSVVEMRLAGDPTVLVQGDGEDIAVLLLGEDFEEGRLPWASEWPAEIVAGSNVTLRSYGDTDPAEDVVVFGVQMERTAPVYDILPGTFAADVGGCNGDSGGPGLDDGGRVLGVASYADLPACGGWTRFERLDVQREMIQQAIDDTGGVDPPPPDAGAWPDAATGTDAGDEPPPPGGGGGCSCRLAP